MRCRASVFFAVTLAAFFVFPVNSAGQDTTGAGAIAGTVISHDRQPGVAVTICLENSIRCVLSDEAGKFRLPDVRAGAVRLEVTPPGEPRFISGVVAVRAGLDAIVEIVLPPRAAVEQTVTVTASAFAAAEEIKTSSFLVRPAEIRESAGALQDVSRYLQSLPGVVIGANDFRNDVIVRGGGPLENLFIVDNIEIPNINAFANFASAGGTVSILDTELIQDVTFLTGGYPAPYINRVSSVLQIAQREGDRERVRGRATLGFAGAGTIFEGPIGRGKGSWIVSARRSFLDFFTKDVGFGGVPVLYTLNAKAVYDPTPSDRLWLVNVSGVDRIRLGLTEDTDLDEGLADFDIRYRGWRSATGLNWQRIFGTSGVGLFSITHSQASVTSTVKDLVRDAVPAPGTPVEDIIDRGPLVFTEGSREGETTVKYDLTTYSRMMGRRQKIQAGGSFKIFRLDYDTGSPLGDDSPFSVEPGINPFTLSRSFNAYQTGAYLQGTMDLGARFNLTWGGRLDHYQYTGHTRVSPRAGVGYKASERLTWSASYGQYFQQPFFLFLASFPENERLKPLRADHFVTGLTYRPSDSVRATFEAYYKRYTDYPVSTQFPALSLANVGDTFNVREVLFPMTSAGRGRAAGIEAFIEKAPGGRWYGQANLSLAKSEHAGLDGVLRPGAFDYPYVLNVTGGVNPAPRWLVSARASLLGGRPYTPFDTALSAGVRRGVFDLTRLNDARAPAYFRLDLRVQRAFTSRRSFVLFAGVQNITNRRNFAGYSWNRRTNQVRFQDQQGLFPILGFDWNFLTSR